MVLSVEEYAYQIEKIRRIRKKRFVVSMLTVFGDESYDEKKERIFVIAGVMASQEEWDEFEPIWNERLNGKFSHAADCESDRGDFKSTSHKANLNLYADLVKILSKTNFIGYGTAVNIKNYNEVFINNSNDIFYYWCFANVVKYFNSIANLHIPKQKAKFIFHQNDSIDYSAGLLYHHFANLPDFKFNSLFDEISFATQKKVGIQCADLFAREIMKHIENRFLMNKKRNLRESLRVLSSTGRFEFLYQDKKYLENFKKTVQKIDQEKNFNTDLEYKEWLVNKKLQNNTTNKIIFLITNP